MTACRSNRWIVKKKLVLTMDEFLDEMDDEQVDDLLQPEEGEDKAPQLYEHFRFVADRGQSFVACG